MSLRCIYTIIDTMQVSIDHAMGSRENISEPIAQILQDNEKLFEQGGAWVTKLSGVKLRRLQPWASLTLAYHR